MKSRLKFGLPQRAQRLARIATEPLPIRAPNRPLAGSGSRSRSAITAPEPGTLHPMERAPTQRVFGVDVPTVCNKMKA
jgi:hypothetical protein